jgi:hypothetical protein
LIFQVPYSHQDVWVLTCRVNDRLVDQSQSNDPVIDLVKIMQRAIVDHVHEDFGETAKPHDESPQELGQTIKPGREPREDLDETGNPHREPPEAGWP